MKTAIVCLNSKYVHKSLAPWYLEAAVSDLCSVAVLEGTINEPPEKILRVILSCGADLIGFSCYIWNIREVLSLLPQIRKALPKCRILLGGPEVSFHPRKLLDAYPEIDYIICGEGEEPLQALVRYLDAGTEPEPRMPGVCSRKYPEDIPPYFSESVPKDPYTRSFLDSVGGRIVYLESSRGCPFRCAFCLSGNSSSFKYFPLPAVFDQILTLANSGTQTVKFVDRTFNSNPDRCNSILRFIGNNYGKRIPEGICFHFEIAGDILRQETIDLLCSLPKGAVQLEIGLQSFHEKTLDAVRRHTDLIRLKENIQKLLAPRNMHIHIDLIAGLPFEDYRTFGRSFDTAYALGADMLQLGFLKLIPGCDMREHPERYGVRFRKDPPYEVTDTDWLSAEDLDRLHRIEDALDRLYNSGRFRRTLRYLHTVSEVSPFTFYEAFALSVPASAAGISLDEYAARFFRFASELPGADPEVLRDHMLCDRIATSSSPHLPAFMKRMDPLLKKAKLRVIRKHHLEHARNLPLGVGILYSQDRIVYSFHDRKDPVTQEYPLQFLPLKKGSADE